MNLPEPRDSLSSVLGSWRVGPQRNPQFRARVWSRIEAGRNDSSWVAYARSHAAVVAGVLAVAVLAGALTGRERARIRVAMDRDRLATSYVESMDARSMRMP